MSSLEKAHVYSNVLAKMLTEYNDNSHLYEKEDIDRAMTIGWLVREAVFNEKLDEDAALRRITDVLKWRKQYGITRRTDEYFPVEFYQNALMFPYNKDKKGHAVLIFRLEAYEKLARIKKPLKQFLLHQLGKEDMEHHADGLTLVISYINATHSKTNAGMIWFLLKKIKKYFPSVKLIVHYNASAFFTTLAILANRANKSQTENQFVEKATIQKYGQIFKYIEVDQLPKFLSGSCSRPLIEIPTATQPLIDTYLKFEINKVEAAKVNDQLLALKERSAEVVDG